MKTTNRDTRTTAKRHVDDRWTTCWICMDLFKKSISSRQINKIDIFYNDLFTYNGEISYGGKITKIS